MSSDIELRLAISADDAAAENQLASDLAESIADHAPDLAVSRLREDDTTQDFGATLAVVLGSAAATKLAHGIAVWLARRQDARLRLERRNPDGSVTTIDVEGSMSARAERVVYEFLEGGQET
jgi:hypothetical protein